MAQRPVEDKVEYWLDDEDALLERTRGYHGELRRCYGCGGVYPLREEYFSRVRAGRGGHGNGLGVWLRHLCRDCEDWQAKHPGELLKPRKERFMLKKD